MPPNTLLLVELTRYGGILVAIAGAWAAAPQSVDVLSEIAREKRQQLWDAAKLRVDKLLRRQPVPTELHPMDALHFSGSGALDVKFHVQATAGVRVEEQLELLRNRLDDLDDALHNNETSLKNFRVEVDSRVTALTSALQETQAALEAYIAALQKASSRVSAWAFGPIVVGISLTAVPDRAISALPFLAWLALMASSLASSIYMAVLARREIRRSVAHAMDDRS